jgi:UrcA family protein
MLKILTALGAAALAASALSTPAAAGPADDGTRVAVSYAGLDLSRPADAARFDRRIRAAARTVCSDAPMLDLGVAARVQACEDSAIARARADLRVALRASGERVLALRTN